jgi:hypothetical protein
VTFAGPSMRPAPRDAGFQFWRPGNNSRVSKLGASAAATRDRLSAMPLEVANVTNRRREISISRYLSSAAGTYCRCAADLDLDPIQLNRIKVQIFV